MTKNFYLSIIFFLGAMLLGSECYSANGSNNQTANNDAQAQQMLKEIQQLQQKQAQQAAAGFGASSQNFTNSNAQGSNAQGSIAAESMKRRLIKAPQYKSDFQYFKL